MSAVSDVSAIIGRACGGEGRSKLLEHEALDLLEAGGIPNPPHALATTEEEAVRAAERVGYPVVLKVVSPPT